MFDIRDACAFAERGAGQQDENWNKRFVSMLRAFGYELVPLGYKGRQPPEYMLMPPEPCELGWRYDYPSVIVSDTYKRRLDAGGFE